MHGSNNTPLDFGIVTKQIEKAYGELEKEGTCKLLPLNDTIKIFQCFYSDYKETFGKEHPKLSQTNIKNVVSKLAVCDEGYPWDAEGYLTIWIQFYFEEIKQRKTRSDGNIQHFVSGGVRSNLHNVFDETTFKPKRIAHKVNREESDD